MPERPEAKVVEHLDRRYVAGDRLDVDIRRPSSAGLIVGGLDQSPTDSLPATTPIDDDRLDSGLATLPQETGHPRQRPAICRHPCHHALWKGQVVVEATTRVGTADRRVVVDVAMVLD